MWWKYIIIYGPRLPNDHGMEIVLLTRYDSIVSYKWNSNQSIGLSKCRNWISLRNSHTFLEWELENGKCTFQIIKKRKLVLWPTESDLTFRDLETVTADVVNLFRLIWGSVSKLEIWQLKSPLRFSETICMGEGLPRWPWDTVSKEWPDESINALCMLWLRGDQSLGMTRPPHSGLLWQRSKHKSWSSHLVSVYFSGVYACTRLGSQESSFRFGLKLPCTPVGNKPTKHHKKENHTTKVSLQTTKDRDSQLASLPSCVDRVGSKNRRSRCFRNRRAFENIFPKDNNKIWYRWNSNKKWNRNICRFRTSHRSTDNRVRYRLSSTQIAYKKGEVQIE